MRKVVILLATLALLPIVAMQQRLPVTILQVINFKNVSPLGHYVQIFRNNDKIFERFYNIPVIDGVNIPLVIGDRVVVYTGNQSIFQYTPSGRTPKVDLIVEGNNQKALMSAVAPPSNFLQQQQNPPPVQEQQPLSPEESKKIVTEFLNGPGTQAAQKYNFMVIPSPGYVKFINPMALPDNNHLIPASVRTLWNANNASADKKNALQKELANTYKIHFMPKEGADYVQLMDSIFKAINQDNDLKKVIQAFKIAPRISLSQKGEIMPRIVFYVTTGKQNAQIALNKLYNYFKNVPGSGQRPRYNAKVNDLIWIAQGDGDSKSEDWYDVYYELPQKTYYKSDFVTGTRENYHLKHPETGQDIIN